MAVSARSGSIAFFITLGACLVAVAIALNVGWILLNWREVALLVFGIIFFLLIIVGLVLNTTFLIRDCYNFSHGKLDLAEVTGRTSRRSKARGCSRAKPRAPGGKVQKVFQI